MQRENTTKDKIVGVLIELKESYGMKSYEVAELVGVSDTYLSNVRSGFKDGGKQLLAGLLLLKELTELKASGVRMNPDLNKELEEIKTRVNELQTIVNRYPEHKPNPMTMNEPKNKKLSSEPTAAAESLLDAAEQQADDPKQR